LYNISAHISHPKAFFDNVSSFAIPTPAGPSLPPRRYYSLLNCPGKKWASKDGMPPSDDSNLTATFFEYDRPSRTRVIVPDKPTEHSPSTTPPVASYPETCAWSTCLKDTTLTLSPARTGGIPGPIVSQSLSSSSSFSDEDDEDEAVAMLGSANGSTSPFPRRSHSRRISYPNCRPAIDIRRSCRSAYRDISTAVGRWDRGRISVSTTTTVVVVQEPGRRGIGRRAAVQQ
jgi:hypothetical protein